MMRKQKKKQNPKQSPKQNPKIVIVKKTDLSLAQEACAMTMIGKKESKISLNKLYRCEHSPVRTQMFWIKMYGIFNYVSVHLVRHKIGVEHFVESHREDRGGSGKEGRYSLVNHGMWLNAQELINIMKVRLCTNASKGTREVIKLIKEEMKKIDPDLEKYLVPTCIYRGGICPELKCCGFNKTFFKNKEK